jgi:SOS-response transcriptional repressor LexA
MMSPEFSENCIIIVDPAMPIHNEAYVIIDFNDELYFRQYVIENNNQLMRCLNSSYEDINLTDDFEVRGCITQQKQRKQKSLHYYLLEKESGEMKFSENCIIIVDPGMPIHNEAYVIIDFNDELYFRQYVIESNKQLLRCLNSSYDDIQLNHDFEVRGCITQQKQRKKKSLHYYLPDQVSGEMTFTCKGKEKEINS